MTETPQEHSSLVGGSTASRRIGCPRSYALEQKVPKSKGSAYAREGTAFHEMLALVLDKDKDPQDLLPFTHKQPAKGPDEAWEHTITHEDWDRLGQPALDMFDEFLEWLEADQDGAPAQFFVEERFEYPGIPDAFGTSDIVFRCGKVGGIWDWKMGRGPVKAENNDQLSFYFNAAMAGRPDFFEGIEEVYLLICQPQVNAQEPDIWEATLEDMVNFDLDLKDAITEINEKGEEAHLEPGPWCKFADCKLVCPKHYGAASKLGEKLGELDAVERGAHDETGAPLADTFDFEAFLSDAMELAEMAEAWSKKVAAMTQERLEHGFDVEGWKLVAKRSSGKDWIVDEETAAKRLASRGLKADDYWNKKIISPSQAITKLKKLGKELPEELYEQKASSGFTLTRDGDPRPEAASPAKKAKALGSVLAARLETKDQ